jgi:hypothetical protein
LRDGWGEEAVTGKINVGGKIEREDPSRENADERI